MKSASFNNKTVAGNMITNFKILACLAAGLFASALVASAQVGVTATMPGTQIVKAVGTLATSSTFDMGSGNTVALLVSIEGFNSGDVISATFAGQPMTLGVSTNDSVQWSGIFYLINPGTTSGQFVITTTGTASTDGAYSAIALGNVGSVAGTDAVASGSSSGTISLSYSTHTNGGFVLAACVNNGWSSSYPPPDLISGNPDQTLFSGTVDANDGHLQAYGAVPNAGTYTDVYGNLYQRNAYVTLAFDTAELLPSLSWATGSGVWDINTTANWNNGTGTAVYQQLGGVGNPVVFEDSLSGTSPIAVTLDTTVNPVSVTVTNSSKAYTISGTGNIGGNAALTKMGSGMLTLDTTNSFSGGSVLDGGTTVFSTLNNLGTGNITFGGGTLQYASGNVDDISTRTVTIGAGGATIDDGGNTISFANPIGNGGTGSFTKTGTGTLTLNGTNDYSGNSVVNQGTLALGPSTFLPGSPAIIVNSGAILDAATSGLTLNGAVNQTLDGAGTVNGGVNVPTATTISPATNGVFGTLAFGNDLTISGGTLDMDISGASKDLITVSGNLTLSSGTLQLNVSGTLPYGTYTLIQYSGSLSGAAANLALVGISQAGASATLDSSVAGQINLVVAPVANDNLTWSGGGSSWDLLGTMDWLNGVQPWAFTNGDTVTFNDSASGSSTVQLQGSLQPAAIIVNNTTIPTYTFADNGGKILGSASLTKDGTGTLIVETANSYTGPTTIKNGTLQIGNGVGGDIGTGAVTNNGALVFEQGDSANHFVDGVISGTGSLTVNGNATVILTNNNTYAGATTISNGTLQVGLGGPTGSLGSDAAVTDNGTLALNNSGSVSFPYNVSGSGVFANQGPATVSLGGNLTYQGNTYVDNGVVKITANNQIPSVATVAGSTGSLNLDGGAAAGTLDLNGFNQTVNALSGAAGTVNGVITNSSGTASTLTVLNSTNGATTYTYNGQIMDGTTGGKTALFVTGGAALILNPPTQSTFSGGMVISNSTVALGAPGGAATVNPDESVLAPGTGPITLLGTSPALYLAGSTGSTTPYYSALTNAVVVPAGQSATIYGPSRGKNNMLLSGSGTLNYISTYYRGEISDWSGFTGQVFLTGIDGGYLGLDDANGLANAKVDITSNLVFYCRVSGVPNVYIGQLTGGDPSDTIESTSSGNAGGADAIFAIGGLNTDSSYGGRMINHNGLLKVGTGTLLLNGGGFLTTNLIQNGLFFTTNISYGTNMMLYTGSTTVSNGVLKLAVPVNLVSSTPVTLASPTAVLDASSMGYISTNVDVNGDTNQVAVTNGLFEVVANQTFGGIGTLRGSLMADTNSTIAAGLPLGTLTVTGSVELAGAVVMSVNATGTPNSSELDAPGFTIDSTATLVVTNLGPEQGATFQLFNHPVNFSSVTLPTLSGTNTWIDNLSTDGSITMVAPAPTPPAPVITSFSLSGPTLNLTATNGAFNGTYSLLESTNLATPLSNWVQVVTGTFDGSGTLNLSTNLVDPAVPQEFFLLSQ